MIRLLLVASLTIPLGLDLYMPVPEENPMTADKIELGRRLFNDRRLSRDGSTACVYKRALFEFLRSLSGSVHDGPS